MSHWSRFMARCREQKGSRLALGVAVGVAFGAAMGNVGLGVALGAALGAAYTGMRTRRDRE